MLLIAQDQETLRVESPVAASDPRFADYVASLVGAPVEPGDAYTVLRNGDGVSADARRDRASAKTRINFETYVFKDGDIGDRFLAALERAAQRGVTVRMILDPIGSVLGDTNSERLKKAGAQLAWFNPLGFWALEESNYRTHRKTLVVDGDVAFTGGMGIADQWLGNAQDKEHWRDTQFQDHRSRRARARSVVLRKLDRIRRPSRRRRSIPSCRRGATGARSVVVWSNPMAGASNVKLLYLLAIGAARKTHRHPIAVHHARPVHALEPRPRRASAASGFACWPKARSPTPCRSSTPAATTTRICSTRASRSSNTSRR